MLHLRTIKAEGDAVVANHSGSIALRKLAALLIQEGTICFSSTSTQHFKTEPEIVLCYLSIRQAATMSSGARNLSPWMRIIVKGDYDDDFPDGFLISSSIHCTLFSGNLVRNSMCSMKVNRTFADISRFQEILQNKFPDEQFPKIVSPKNQHETQTRPSAKELFPQRHRLCKTFFDFICLCHHVMFSKDLRLFLSASEASYRDYVSSVFTDGNFLAYRLYQEGKYASAKRAFLNACERYKVDSDPHGAAMSASYAIQALAKQRYWSDIMEAAQFSLPIFKESTDIYGVVWTLCHLGRACLFLGDSNTAKKCYLDASTVVAKYEIKDLSAVVCKHLADFHHRFGDIQESIELMRSEMLGFRSTTDAVLHLDFKLYLSQLLLQHGTFEEALSLSQQVTNQLLALPDDVLQGKNPGQNRVWIEDHLHSSALLIQANYYLVHRDLESAEALAKKALSICRSNNSVGISCWLILGKCDLFKSACHEALKTFQNAITISSFAFCETGLKAQVYKGLILSEFLCDHQQKAVSDLALLRDTALSSFNRLTHSQSLRTEALIARNIGDFDCAKLALEKCLSLVCTNFSDFSLRIEACKVRLLFCEVCRMTGNYGLSLKYCSEAKTILESHNHVDFLLTCQVLRSLGELELLKSKVGEGIRLLEQALDLVIDTCFKYETTMCLGALVIGHAMVGDFIRAFERLKKMKQLASGTVNSVSVIYESVVSDVVTRLQALSAASNASTSFPAKAREDDRPLTLVISSEQITIYDCPFSKKHKDSKSKKLPVAIVSHRLDDSVMVAPSNGNNKGIILQGRSSTPMFMFKTEDLSSRLTILQLTSCLVSNNRPSPYLTTISVCDSDVSKPISASSGGPTDTIDIALIPRCMKGNVVPVRVSHLDCQLLDQTDGSVGGTAVLSSDPLESGAYPIRIRASKPGTLHLHVNLLGHPVVGSPLEIRIKKCFPSLMCSSASFYQTAIQNETNFLVFHLCDNTGSPIELLELDASAFKFQFRYVNRTAIALELEEVEVKLLACINNSVFISAVFPYSGDLVLYVDFFDEGLTPTSVNIRCLSSTIVHLLSMSSLNEAHSLLAKSKLNRSLYGLSVSLFESPECRQCLQIYLSFREVLSALVQNSHGKRILSCF
jgi:tetratricopeptide (TPR) repeat protein